MEVKTDYTFDKDAKVSEVSDFIRERHLDHGGWDITTASDTEVVDIGGYSSGALRIGLTESHDGGD